jgi:hypothetical protein
MLGLGLVVALSFATMDYCAAKYVRAMIDAKRHVSARWAVAQWAASAVGFVLVIKVTLWLMPFEAVGIYVGSWLGSKRRL